MQNISTWIDAPVTMLAFSLLSSVTTIAVVATLYRRTITTSHQLANVVQREIVTNTHHATSYNVDPHQLEELIAKLSRLEQFQRRLIEDQSVFTEIQTQLSDLRHAVSHQDEQAEVRNSSEARHQFAREMAHALKTPLSRIDAISLTIQGGAEEAEVSRYMQRIRAATQVCHVYLNAFRLSGPSSAASSNHSQIGPALQNAALVYSEQSEKQVSLQIRAHEGTASVPDYYLVACLLPLIENAIDACEPGDVVNIAVTQSEETLMAEITNPLHQNFPGKQIFNDGFSTKRESEKSHEGLGLGIARNLVSAVPGGTLDYKLRDNEVTFTVVFPRLQ